MDMLSFMATFFKSQLFITPVYPTTDFTGQTIIVTGANVGLGLEAARHFARLNCANLILACRSASRGEAAKESILTTTKRTDPSCIEVWELDLASNASIKAFAARAVALPRVDVLVENAGVASNKFVLAEGHEISLQVNVFGTFLLALLMLPKLREAGDKFNSTPHLAIVSSEVHRITPFKERNDPDIYATLDDEKKFDGRDRYPLSKLLEVLFVRELVKHTAKVPVITLVNPGFCHSELMRDSKSVEAFVLHVMKALFARTTEVGSRTLVAGATAGAGSHGKFMSDGVNQEVMAWILTEKGADVQKRVYEQTMKILEGVEPGIGRNL